MDVSKLLVILKEQYKLFLKLTEIVEKKKDILVNNKVIELEELIKEENDLQGKVKFIENKLKDWKYHNSPNMRLKDICKLSNDNELKELRKNILEKAQHIQRINECNFILIKYNLDFIDFKFKTISGIKENNKMYSLKKSFNISGKFNICNMKA